MHIPSSAPASKFGSHALQVQLTGKLYHVVKLLQFLITIFSFLKDHTIGNNAVGDFLVVLLAVILLVVVFLCRDLADWDNAIRNALIFIIVFVLILLFLLLLIIVGIVMDDIVRVLLIPFINEVVVADVVENDNNQDDHHEDGEGHVIVALDRSFINGQLFIGVFWVDELVLDISFSVFFFLLLAVISWLVL